MISGDTANNSTTQPAWGPPPRAKWLGVPVPVWFCLFAAAAVPTIDGPLAHARLFMSLPESFTAALGRLEPFGHGVGVATIIAAVWALDRDRRRMLPRLLAAAGAGMLANVGKLLVARQRPYYWADQGTGLATQFVEWLPFGGNGSIMQSFPSGHTATAVGLALGLSAMYPAGRVFFLTMGGLVAVQRVVFDAHYVSDVLAASALAWVVVRGLFCTPSVAQFFDRLERRATTSVVAVESASTDFAENNPAREAVAPPARRAA